MALVLTEEQERLKEMAHEFVRDRAPVSALCKLRDELESPSAMAEQPTSWDNSKIHLRKPSE